MNLNKYMLLLMMLVASLSCKTQENEQLTKRYVDEILPDSKLDDKNFVLCHGEEYVIQYFNNSKGLEYEGEKTAIMEQFSKHYSAKNVKKEDGLIRIRFIVNCKGEAGRYRVLETDNNYQKKKFDNRIVDQLLTITKALDGWKPKVLQDKTRDYYQYLIFKIDQGELTKILP